MYASLKRPQALLDLLNRAQESPPTTDEEETQLALEMHRIAMDDVTVIPMSASATHYFYHEYVHDGNFLKWATWPWWTPAEVWLDK